MKSTLVPPADAAAAAMDTCKQAERLDCKTIPCSWSEAQAKLPSCANPPLAPWLEARCGIYRTLVASGTDSAIYYLYDQAGELVAYVEKGLSARGCYYPECEETNAGAWTHPAAIRCARERVGHLSELACQAI